MHLKRRNNWLPGVSALNALNDYTWQRHLAEKTIDFLRSDLVEYCNFLNLYG